MKVRNLPSRPKVKSPSVRFRIDFGPGSAVGPGKIRLLEQIERCGSLSQAARNLNVSYRHAWGLLDSLNSSFVEPVVLTSKGGRGGGGATLTPLGVRLIQAYHAFDARIQVRAAQCFRPFKVNVSKKSRAASRAPVVHLYDR